LHPPLTKPSQGARLAQGRWQERPIAIDSLALSIQCRSSTTSTCGRRSAARTSIRRGLEDKRYAHAFAELIGKVGREIGGNAAEDTRPVIFHFHTNLNPLALAGPQSPMRRIIDGKPSSRAVGAPGLPVQAGGGRRPSTPERPQDVTSETSEVGDR
jgi:hypothetical protein